MKVATWNVNSIRSRFERLERWLARHQPDVVCLQETKCPDDRFPAAELQALGYHSAVHGQRLYNGVAILSRHPLEDVTVGLGDGVDDDQARIVSARTAGVRVISAYVPNGTRVLSEAYTYKLEWMRRLRMMLDRDFLPSEPIALCGDFNVIPEPRDAARWAMWSGTVMATAEVRRLFEEITRFGLVDVLRLHHPGPDQFSWWDYRNRGFEKDQGIRIDFVLASQTLAERCSTALIDRTERNPKSHPTTPSDHAPLLAVFADAS